MTILITDHWPHRGDSFIRVQNGPRINDFPYSDSYERTDQLENANEYATKRAKAESVDVADNTATPQIPEPMTEVRRRRR